MDHKEFYRIFNLLNSEFMKIMRKHGFHIMLSSVQDIKFEHGYLWIASGGLKSYQMFKLHPDDERDVLNTFSEYRKLRDENPALSKMYRCS